MTPQMPSRTQRKALHLASHKGGVIVCTTKDVPRDQVRTATANKLVLMRWATRHNDRLLITKAGRAILNKPIEDTAVYLRNRDGLTTQRWQAVFGESEVTDPATLDPFWEEKALVSRFEVTDKREDARRMQRRMRAA